MVFGRHVRHRLQRVLRRPAVLFVATSPLGARLVQQELADVLPDRVRTVQPGGIYLDLDDSPAAAAAHPQQMMANLVEPLQPLAPSAPASIKTACQFGRQVAVRRQSTPTRDISDDGGGHLVHLLSGRHAPLAGRAVMSQQNIRRTNEPSPAKPECGTRNRMYEGLRAYFRSAPDAPPSAEEPRRPPAFSRTTALRCVATPHQL